MLLEIRHITRYHYENPIRESVMEVWMQPKKSSSQRLISFELLTDPHAQLFSYGDVYGNAVYHFDVPQPHDSLTIEVNTAVETSAFDLSVSHLDMGEWDRLRSAFIQGESFDFLRPHGFTTQTKLLEDFIEAQDLDDLKRRDPLSAVLALNTRIYEAFAYTPGVTKSDSPIDHALSMGGGVCQDFAHIMITICRSWGIPARYVSGYLLSDHDHGERSDPDASHAWVEVFLPTLRWFGLDPTNNVIVGERHISVAIGRDYDDVPPSRGVFKGNAASELAVAVSVRRAKAAITDPEFLRLARPAFRPRSSGRIDELRQSQQQQQQQ
jgi:transglutaminase-like putative cysteine protease